MKSAYIAIAVALVSQTIDATEPTRPSTGVGTGVNGDESAKRFMEGLLNNCPETEVRCLWFSGDRINVAQMMTIDLKNWHVTSVTHNYAWSAGGRRQRELTRWQLKGLKEAMTELPSSLTVPEYSKSVQIAYWHEGKLQRRSYDKKACPIEVRRVYEIGGEEAPFEYQATVGKIPQPQKPENSTTFIPPKEYRTIEFPEYGGGPSRLYQADGFSEIVTLYESKDLKIIFSEAKPPTTATHTTVAGLFVLLMKDGAWCVTDSRRFEAVGKDSGAKAESTQSESAEPHISLTLLQGGRGHSYVQCASYKVEGAKFIPDTPKEKPPGNQNGDGKQTTRPEPK